MTPRFVDRNNLTETNIVLYSDSRSFDPFGVTAVDHNRVAVLSFLDELSEPVHPSMIAAQSGLDPTAVNTFIQAALVSTEVVRYDDGRVTLADRLKNQFRKPKPLPAIDPVYRAYRVAVEKHADQVRKNSSIPYIAHVLTVAEQLAIWNIPRDKEPDVWAAAMLHDTVEDTDCTVGTIAAIFGSRVAQYVEMLTFRDQQSGESKNDYQAAKTAHLGEFGLKPIEVVVIKLADRYRNTLDFANGGDPSYAIKYLSRASGLTGLVHLRRNDIIIRFGQQTASTITRNFQLLASQLHAST